MGQVFALDFLLPRYYIEKEENSDLVIHKMHLIATDLLWHEY